MTPTLIATIGVSAITAAFVVASSRAHLRFTGDRAGTGPQKFHVIPVPRIGGLAILAGLVVGLLFVDGRGYGPPADFAAFGIAILPIFLAGFAEDLSKRIRPRVRLIAAFVGAAAAFWLLDAELRRLDLPFFDALLRFTPLAFVVTLFCVGGVAHAINIIDGYNGLAGVVSAIILTSILIVAVLVGDAFVASISVAAIGAVIGFLIWNYPRGWLFAGDGGAYLLGFTIALLSVLLVTRNEQVSAWFPLLLCAYPVWETLFSIYRKKSLRGQSPGEPDGVHLHMLIYKRLVRYRVHSRDPNDKWRRNALTSPYLWALSILSAVPALVFWNDTLMLMAFAALFVAGYCTLYWRIVRFRAPRWMILRVPAKDGQKDRPEFRGPRPE